jgi:NitT/TauT family transport system substrate-binding protein
MRNHARRINKGLPAATLLLLAMVVFGVWSCSKGGYSGKVESISVGVSTPLEANTLLYVADKQGFFRDNGLKVTIKDYETGVAAIGDMLKGEVDIAVPSEFGVVRHVLQGKNIRILTCYDKVQIAALITRKDRGIGRISDLKGKRIGLPRHTNAEFYLGRFLDLNRMSIQDVNLEDGTLPRLVDAMVNGETDAVVLWEPYRSQVENRLRDKVVVWPVQSSQPAFCVMVAGQNWLSEHPQTAGRFLHSLAQAERYLDRHPPEVRTYIQEKLKYDKAYMDVIWPRQQFALSLDQSLVTAMEDEARWMMTNNLTPEKKVPDFLNYLYVDGLKAIKPEAVNIIR